MKKLITILMCAVLALSLFACAGGETSSSYSDSEGTAEDIFD